MTEQEIRHDLETLLLGLERLGVPSEALHRLRANGAPACGDMIVKSLQRCEADCLRLQVVDLCKLVVTLLKERCASDEVESAVIALNQCGTRNLLLHLLLNTHVELDILLSPKTPTTVVEFRRKGEEL